MRAWTLPSVTPVSPFPPEGIPGPIISFFFQFGPWGGRLRQARIFSFVMRHIHASRTMVSSPQTI